MKLINIKKIKTQLVIDWGEYIQMVYQKYHLLIIVVNKPEVKEA